MIPALTGIVYTLIAFGAIGVGSLICTLVGYYSANTCCAIASPSESAPDMPGIKSDVEDQSKTNQIDQMSMLRDPLLIQ